MRAFGKLSSILLCLLMVGTIFALPVNVMATETIPDGMVSYWRLDESSGKTAEDWADGNDGILEPSDQVWVTGKMGSALSFDGSDDQVIIPPKSNQYGMSQLTLESWVYRQKSTQGTVLAKWENGNYEDKASYALEIANEKMYALIKTDGKTYGYIHNQGSTITLNQWHHIAMVWDGTTSPGTLKTYMDGTLQYSISGNQLTGVIDTMPDMPIYIGTWNTGEYQFNGKIDEIRISNTLRYSGGSYTVPTTEFSVDSETIALWHFDEGIGTTINDETSNDNDGTLYGEVAIGPLWTGGKIGNALSFDGIDDQVIVPSKSIQYGMSQLTLESWIYRQKSTQGTVLAKWENGNYEDKASYALEIANEKLYALIKTDGKTYGYIHNQGSTISLNQWHHIAMVWDGTTSPGTLKTYMDGTLQYSISGNQLTGVIDSMPDMPIYIGTWNTGEYQFNGKIDEVRFSNTLRYSGGTYTVPTSEFSVDSETIALWHFDEGSGIIVTDSTANNNDGTLEPNGPQWTTGRVGGALNFDGIDDYVNVGNNPSLDLSSDLTVEAWIYPTTLTTHRPIVSKGESLYDRTQEYALFMFYDELHFRIGTAGKTSHYITLMEDDAIMTTNEWHHVAATMEGSFGRLYLDGVLVDSEYGIGTRLIADNFNTHIGKYRTSPIGFEGRIDEVAIWDKTLTPDEILLHYTNGLIGEGYTYIPPDLAVQYLFEDIQEEGLPEGSENSLLAKLNAALESLDNGDDQEAMNILNAFINAVEAQRGKKLTDAQATALIAAAQEILDTITGS
jgi:hypothetical protein